jgi:hypothetical protein
MNHSRTATNIAIEQLSFNSLGREVFSKGKPTIGMWDQALLPEHLAAAGPLPCMKDL